MMGDLLFTSMFCNDADMFLDTFAPQTPDQPMPSDHLTPTLYNVLQQATTSPNVSSNDVTSNYTTTSPVFSSSIDSQSQSTTTTCSSSSDALLSSCSGTMPSYFTCQQDWLKSLEGAKVDISTFGSVHPDTIFDNYIQAISYDTKVTACFVDINSKSNTTPESCESGECASNISSTAKVNTQKSSTSTSSTNEDSTPSDNTENLPKSVRIVDTQNMMYQFDDVVIFRPPYRYSALVAAAIYSSGKSVLSYEQICDIVREMFPEFKIACKPWKKLWKKNVNSALRVKTYFVHKHTLGYSLNNGTMHAVLYEKVNLKERHDTHKYADFLFDHLDMPNILQDIRRNLGIDSTVTVPTSRIRTTKRSADTYDIPLDLNPKRISLDLPPRPCFADDNSNGSDELFGSPDSVPNTTEQDSGYEEFRTGLGTPISVTAQASNTRLPPISCLLPEKSMFIGQTVRYVDMLVDGRLLKVPVQITGPVWL